MLSDILFRDFLMFCDGTESPAEETVSVSRLHTQTGFLFASTALPVSLGLLLRGVARGSLSCFPTQRQFVVVVDNFDQVHRVL